MEGETKERRKQLCEQAAIERDSKKLLELVRDDDFILVTAGAFYAR